MRKGGAFIGLPEGSRVFTPQQKEAYDRWQEIQLIRASLKDQLPNSRFTFIQGNALRDIAPATAAQLVFLSTYLKFGCSALMLTQRSPIRRSDLPELLRVSRATVDRTIDDADGMLTFDASGTVCLNAEIFRRGTLPKNHGVYHKVFHNSIRSLWTQMPTSKQKHLGYIFQMLPFLNLQHNFLCWDPMEANLEAIRFLSLFDFAREIGLRDLSNVSRLRTIYRGLTFQTDGSPEAICAVEGLGKTSKVIINPALVYAGSSPESIHAQRALCRAVCQAS